MRVIPPLTITDDELDHGLRIIADALSGAADSGEPAPAVRDPGPAD